MTAPVLTISFGPLMSTRGSREAPCVRERRVATMLGTTVLLWKVLIPLIMAMAAVAFKLYMT